MRLSSFGRSRAWYRVVGSAAALLLSCATTVSAQTNTFPSSGNTGIGTTSPSQLLDVRGGSDPAITVTNTAMSASPSLYIGMNDGNNAALFQTLSNKDFKFFNGKYFTIKGSSGNVGIGTTTPSQLLELSGNSEPAIAITNTAMSASPSFLLSMNSGNDAALLQTLNNKDFKFYNGQYAMTIKGNGNVGIGVTDTAYYKLDVAGPGGANSIYSRATDAGLTRFGLQNTNRHWTLNNYGTGSSPQGTFAINDETASSTRFWIDQNGTVFTASHLTTAGAGGTGNLTVNGAASVTGNLTVSGNIAAKYQDIAEWVDAESSAPAGTVVVIDTTANNRVRASSKNYDTSVAGVVSPQPGITLGERSEGQLLVAHSGRVRVKVDASFGAIQAGDLLVTSPIEGVAMRSQPMTFGGLEVHRPGTILGKALEPLKEGQGTVLALLTLQ